jgi:hypothetical protein
MATPDFTPYVDLTLFDKTAQTIYDESVEYAKTAFPEFNPRPGTTENAILEASSVQTESLITAINRLPNSLMQGLLSLMGFDRISATPSQANITFEVTINTGVTIAAGTVVSFDVFDSDGVLTQYLYETSEDLEIASGNTSGTVSATAVTPSQYPDIPAASTLTLISTSPFILTVTMGSVSTVGTDAETDTDYFNRAVRFLASLNASLVTASQMTNYISTAYPTVARFKVYDLTDSSDMEFSAADAPGSVTVSLCDSDGNAISSAQKTIIENDLESRIVAGVSVDMHDTQVILVDVTINVVSEPNYSTATVALAVTDAIEAYLSVAGWDWKETVDSKYLSSIASRVPGVRYVDTCVSELAASSSLATESGNNVTILEKGVIPIGNCTTTAVSGT